MAKILSISSQVVHGHVGNSVSVFTLQSLGHHVCSLPTVLLSNRPGYPAIAGTRVAPEVLNDILAAGIINGWLLEIDAIITGYLPSAAHVDVCATWVADLKKRRADVLYLCDPILGDDPVGVYIDEAAASAVHDKLRPLADIITPNRFELAWLSGNDISDIESAGLAARRLGVATVVVTSAPAETPGMLSNLLYERGEMTKTTVTQRVVHAHGTGDFFASVFLAHKLRGASSVQGLRAATAAMERVLDASAGFHELALVESRSAWAPFDPL